MPDSGATAAHAVIADELRILLAFAMADGTLDARERTLLERYTMVRARESRLVFGASEVATALRQAQADTPRPEQLAALVNRLRMEHPEALAGIWETAQVLCEADGRVTAIETVRLARLKQLLEQDCNG